jgi:hypothetical protein
MDLRFFITGHGRSGTLWLARVLNCDPVVNVHHEPLAQFDAKRYAKVYAGEMDALDYVQARIPRMRSIWARHPGKGYAEVNSYLRYVVPELRYEFDVPVLGIVRDGRYVVRSLMARGCYQREDYPEIQPPERVYGRLTPFEACCWYWATTYRLLERQQVPLFYLEKLSGDYGYFCELCHAAGVTVRHENWLRHAGKRANVGVKDEEPPVWDAAQWAQFEALAGDVQRALGYPMQGGL